MKYKEAKIKADIYKTLVGKKINNSFGTIHYVIPAPIHSKNFESFLKNFLMTEDIDSSAFPFMNQQFEVIVMPDLNSLKTKGIKLWLLLEEALNHLDKK
jgi:hypothetical protein